jgi:C-terminal processing protease CtpA/Prc
MTTVNGARATVSAVLTATDATVQYLRRKQRSPLSVTLHATACSTSPLPTASASPGTVGYLQLPSGGSSATDAQTEYAEATQQALQSADAQSPCGWMLDLRTNTGGNVTRGIGPLAGDSQLGGHILPDSTIP